MLDSIVALRRDLHRHPELSGEEVETARRIVRFFAPLKPDALVERLGGHGVAVVFAGRVAGPTVLLRGELDALPIPERAPLAHRSTREGVSHSCGHDGHMAMLAALGQKLSARRPARGCVVLLYQPAEETGEGAPAVLRDPKFAPLKPDLAFALHNLPGFPLGQVVLRAGTMCCASRGMAVRLAGTAAHAAQPETGTSPAAAMCRLIERLADLSRHEEGMWVTVVGARLGKKAFGTAPGQAEIWATLRSETDEAMAALVGRAEDLARACASAEGLGVEIAYEDVFDATVNAPRAVEIVRKAVGRGGVRLLEQPFRWSEDFGRFTVLAPGALVGIGAGESIPDLHHPDYDFPDALIPLGTTVLERVVEVCLAEEAAP